MHAAMAPSSQSSDFIRTDPECFTLLTSHQNIHRLRIVAVQSASLLPGREWSPEDSIQGGLSYGKSFDLWYSRPSIYTKRGSSSQRIWFIVQGTAVRFLF
jgi:hypothetical protein